MTGEHIRMLAHGVRFKVLGKYLGELTFIQALLSLLPMLVAILFEEEPIAITYGVIVIILLLLHYFSRRLDAPAVLQTNEAYCLVALAFCLSPLLMAIPMYLNNIPFIDALFEAVSGVTTTGLSTLRSVEEHSNTFLFARAWMQWYGGLGIVVFSIALLSDHHLARRQFMEGSDTQHLVTETRTYARAMLMVYTTLTILGILLLWLITGKGFDATVLIFSAVSTGGFAPYDDSLLQLSLPAKSVVMLFSTLGAIALPIYMLLWQRQWRNVLRDPELQLLFILGIFVSLALASIRLNHLSEPITTTITEALLLGFSAQTTTGFASQSLLHLDTASKIILVTAMLIGGGMGSTAGGIKLMRIIMLWKTLQHLLHRTAIPAHAVDTIRIGQHTISDHSLRFAHVFIILIIGVVIFSWCLFVLAGHDPVNSLFEVVSAVGTVGLSAGVTRIELESWLKAVLMFDMLAGRLELIALLILLYPRTWLTRKGTS